MTGCRQCLSTTLRDTKSTTPPNLLPVSFVALSQGGIGGKVGVNAHLKLCRRFRILESSR